ncbi:hypothetical protein QFC24_000732 [Naganishia onofrii]|uniref:Uncharacterized protein n=2 Tax=Naganishia onofrii TaxID=1851511 RepID=A0ACC2XUP7_9TREE|nr:hypothetical protein QFC24_000727 [Naganishia onofrii]KAJ9127325.1 hypothetical protein QFC24_000732 [Naganishia onofrii]
MSTSSYTVSASAAPAAPEAALQGVISPEGYTMLHELGSGGYATVYKARRESDGEIFAIKVVNTTDMDEREIRSLRRELSIHESLDHSNIVQYVDVSQDVQRQLFFIVLEFCPGGDLAELIERHFAITRYINEDLIWGYLRQLAGALEHLHEPSSRSVSASTVILHRDIKPANILMSEDQLHVKLADFGLARETEVEEWATSYCGTMDYMSPEMCAKDVTAVSTNEASDIWSLGCVMYELCALQPLFIDDDDESVKRLIRKGISPRLPSAYSSELGDVLQAMLSSNPLERPSATELLKLSISKLDSLSSAWLSETLEQNQDLCCRIAELEAQVAFLQENAVAKEQAAAEQRREDEAERSFYDREISKLKKKADGERDARHNYQVALASAHTKIQQLEQQNIQQDAELAAQIDAVASREAAIRLREQALAAQERDHQKVVQKSANVAVSVVKRHNVGHRAVPVTVPVKGLPRYASNTSCSSFASSSATGNDTSRSASPTTSAPSGTSLASRIPRSIKREKVLTTVSVTSNTRPVNLASVARAAIAAAAVSGKRKLEALNGMDILGTAVANVQKRPRGLQQFAGLRQRM